MSQRWRAIGNTVSDLTDPRFEPQTSRSRGERFPVRLTGRFNIQYQFYRQHGRFGKGFAFLTTPNARSGFNSHAGHVVACMDKMLYDDYLCLVVQ